MAIFKPSNLDPVTVAAFDAAHPDLVPVAPASTAAASTATASAAPSTTAGVPLAPAAPLIITTPTRKSPLDQVMRAHHDPYRKVRSLHAPFDDVGQGQHISPGTQPQTGAVKVHTDGFRQQVLANLSPTDPDIIRAPELLDEKLLEETMRDGGMSIHVSMPHPYNGRKGSGFDTKVGSRIVRKTDSLEEGIVSAALGSFGHLREAMRKENIYEAVGLIQKTETVYRDVHEQQRAPGIKGFFGGKTIVTRQERTGNKYLRHDEIVENGKPESAVSFVYAATGMEYQDFIDRPGNMLEVEIVLPESLAHRVVAAVKKNPRFVRELIGRMVERQIGISREAWENGVKENKGRPLGPPYKIWDAEKIRSMYVVDRKVSTPKPDTFDPSLIVKY